MTPLAMSSTSYLIKSAGLHKRAIKHLGQTNMDKHLVKVMKGLAVNAMLGLSPLYHLSSGPTALRVFRSVVRVHSTNKQKHRNNPFWPAQ